MPIAEITSDKRIRFSFFLDFSSLLSFANKLLISTFWWGLVEDAPGSFLSIDVSSWKKNPVKIFSVSASTLPLGNTCTAVILIFSSSDSRCVIYVIPINQCSTTSRVTPRSLDDPSIERTEWRTKSSKNKNIISDTIPV